MRVALRCVPSTRLNTCCAAFCRCYADYALADTMAGSAEKVEELLRLVQEPAKQSAEREKTALLPFVGGAAYSVEPWDWRYYAEKVWHAALCRVIACASVNSDINLGSSSQI